MFWLVLSVYLYINSGTVECVTLEDVDRRKHVPKNGKAGVHHPQICSQSRRGSCDVIQVSGRSTACANVASGW